MGAIIRLRGIFMVYSKIKWRCYLILYVLGEKHVKKHTF